MEKSRASAFAACCVGLLLSFGFTGCVVVGASSRGGFFIWPGGLGLIVLIVLIALLLRRR